jgi:hypothetical protein
LCRTVHFGPRPAAPELGDRGQLRGRDPGGHSLQPDDHVDQAVVVESGEIEHAFYRTDL